MSDLGVILVDKPPNITSFDIIRKLRKITGIKKIGHSGTLDPFATGLMQICIGKATRIVSKLSNNDKTYTATCRLGIQTDTGDTTGEVIKKEKVPNITNEQLEEIKDKILNLSAQIPPKFSAVKINGKRAYELARQKQEVQLKSRPIKIFDFRIDKFVNNELTYTAHVSKGTYIRVLSETIAEALRTIGTTITLRRTKIGNNVIEDAVKLEDIQESNWRDYLIPLEVVFTDHPKYVLDPKQIQLFKNGGKLDIKKVDLNEVMVLDNSGRCVGFGNVLDGYLKPKLVLI